MSEESRLNDILNNDSVESTATTLMEVEPISIDTSNKENILSNVSRAMKLSNLVNVFEWSKENTSTVLVWITAIGAFIQIIELAVIDLSYIRFFSVSQLISDGALVLLVFGTYTLMYLISHKFLFFESALKSRYKRIENGEIFGFNEKYFSFISASITIFFVMDGLANFTNMDTINGILWLVVLMLPVATYLNYVLLRILLLNLYYIVNTNDDFKIDVIFLKVNIKILYIIINIFAILAGILMFIVALAKFLILIYLSIRVPYYIDNYNHLEQKIAEDYDGLQDYRLLYFNDVYTFVEISKPEDKDSKLISHSISGANYNVSFYKNTDKKVVIYKTEDVLF
ncbi:hypothetical protein [Psychrobacter sp. ASPA161_9]|uniref:hypothetical protein n=1 Tax=Psychrobacter sp. ASPA161_9 TaxID=3160961 RepID=UPI003F7CF4F3